MSEKIRSITVDTLTTIQENQYMAERRKPNYDKWRDYSVDIWNFIKDLQDMGFEIIMVIGDPGVGKSSGMRTLPHNSNIWFNADNKNPVWSGGKEEYGKKTNPRKPYHQIPKSYKDITSFLKTGIAKGKFEDERYAILTGHIEDYKSGDQMKQRLKTLGNLAKKMQLEGKLENVFYAKVKIDENGKREYILETQNNGYNTARSPMEAFPDEIPNNYKLVIDTLLNY